MKIQQSEAADFFAPVTSKELDQSMGCGDIGPNRMWAPTPIKCKIVRPARGKRSRRMLFFFF
jgi:hypothetical protein